MTLIAKMMKEMTMKITIYKAEQEHYSQIVPKSYLRYDFTFLKKFYSKFKEMFIVFWKQSLDNILVISQNGTFQLNLDIVWQMYSMESWGNAQSCHT